ncbi:Scavenger receptor class A member 5 [Liparis tanakae]|uniref:Scavenger receptor class A member 5 n=1 Tax=Liparis tanakae TaxID=230148 RepID=A0A4Z2HDC6_9TELE|nr:Scavenger receptor class A member 5 [Liparis tanakae]
MVICEICACVHVHVHVYRCSCSKSTVDVVFSGFDPKRREFVQHELNSRGEAASSSGKRRRKQDQCCAHMNSLSAIKYAIVSLYILVFLTIFGLCLADPVASL